MALDDDAVVVAAQGFVFISSPGAVPPTPDQLEALDPETYGAQVLNVKITGSPTGGVFTLTVGADETDDIPHNANEDQIQAAVEALESVGAGNTKLSGTSLSPDGFDIALIGKLQGATLAIDSDDSGLTGGTSPAVVFTTKTAPNGWDALGHTSRDDLPEFGFDGGKYKMKGTWQKKRLREVEDSDAIEDSVKIVLEQWDATTLEMYYGVNASETPGVFGVDGNFIPVEKAMLIILVDGTAKIGFYVPKASIQRDDSVKLPIDDFAALPIKCEFLNLGSRRLYDWISKAHFS